MTHKMRSLVGAIAAAALVAGCASNMTVGNNFDYNGPMLYTFRVDYRPDMSGADVLKIVDKVIGAVQERRLSRRLWG